MKIGIVTGEYPPTKGGVGDYTKKLATHLTDNGNQVTVITDQRSINTTYDSDSLKVLATISPKWGWLDLWRLRQETSHLDVLSIQYQAAAYGAMTPPIHLLPRFTIPPTVTTFHDLNQPYLFPKAGSLRRKAIVELANKSNGVITTNSEDHDALKVMINLKNLIEIPIGSNIPFVDPNTFSKRLVRSKYNITNNEILIGYFGLMNHTKGGKVLVNTLAELRSMGLNVHLILIGEPTGTTDPRNAEYYAETINLANKLGVIKYITQTGFVDSNTASILLQSCDMMVLPYLNGASLRNGSLIACINNGCPVITTRPETTNTLLRDGCNIIFVDNHNPLSTAKAVTRLYQNDMLRKQIGEEALKLQRHFNWHKIAQKTTNFFSKVLTHP